MNFNNIYKNKTDSWSTPNAIYSFFMEESFFDPCPLDDNGCLGLFANWFDKKKIFVNPPYSNIDPFIDMSINASLMGCKVILLLPVRTGSKWFSSLINYSLGVDIWFIRGRLSFGDSKSSAPFDSMFVFLGFTKFNCFKVVNRDCILENLKSIL